MRKLETLFKEFINAPIQIYSGATFKKGLYNLEDVYNNTADGDTVIVRQSFDMGADNLMLKPNVTLERKGTPTITSSNAVGTIVAVDSNGDVLTTVGTASITGNGLIINTVDVSKRIVGNVNYSETFIAFVHSRDVYAKVTVFRNDFPTTVSSVGFGEMNEGVGNIEINFADDIVDNIWKSEIVCVGKHLNAGKIITASQFSSDGIKLYGIAQDDYYTLTYTRFFNAIFDVEEEFES